MTVESVRLLCRFLGAGRGNPRNKVGKAIVQEKSIIINVILHPQKRVDAKMMQYYSEPSALSY